MLEFFGHPVSPPARAVQMTLLLADVEFKSTEVDLMKNAQLKKEFIKINPAHTVPTIRDGELILWESRAIMQYIFNKYKPESSAYPQDAQARAQVDFLLNWDQNTLYKSLSKAIYPKLGMMPIGPSFEDDEKNFKENLKMLNDHLIREPYLTGENLTLADISVSSSLSMATVIDDK